MNFADLTVHSIAVMKYLHRRKSIVEMKQYFDQVHQQLTIEAIAAVNALNDENVVVADVVE